MKKSLMVDAVQCLDPAFVKRYKDAGFSCATLGMSVGNLLEGPDWKDRIRRVRDALNENGITCCETHLRYYDILRSCESTDAETDEIIRRSVEATSVLGAKWGAWHPRSGHSFGYDRKREFEENRNAILKLLDTAAKCGAGIAVENIPVFPDCPQYDFYLSDPKDHLELVDSLPADLCGICWDTGHANLMPYDQAEVIRSLGNRLKIVHLHTNDKHCDEHEAPGTGMIDWTKVMPAIASTGFAGAITLEVHLASVPVQASFMRYCYDCACWLEDLAGGKTE